MLGMRARLPGMRNTPLRQLATVLIRGRSSRLVLAGVACVSEDIAVGGAPAATESFADIVDAREGDFASASALVEAAC